MLLNYLGPDDPTIAELLPYANVICGDIKSVPVAMCNRHFSRVMDIEETYLLH